MPPELHPGAEVLAVAESPGADETRIGRPLVGRSGNEWNDALRAVGRSRPEIDLTNVLLCQPPGQASGAYGRMSKRLDRENKARSKRGKDPWLHPATCCRPALLNLASKYKYIIPLGKTAMGALTGSGQSIQAVRGGPIGVDEEWSIAAEEPAHKLMPTLHPAFILRSPGWRHVLHADLAKAFRWFNNTLRWTAPDQVLNPTPRELAEWLAQPAPFWTYDVETDGIEPLTCKLRTIAIAIPDLGSNYRAARGDVAQTARAIGVNLLSADGHTKFYGPKDEAQIRSILCRALTDGRVWVGHNAGYYDRMVVESQLGVTPAPLVDTLFSARFRAPDLPKGLKTIGSILTDVERWETTEKGTKIATGSHDDLELLRYNIIDSTVNARIVVPLIDAAATAGAFRSLPDNLKPASWPIERPWDLHEVDHATQDMCVQLHKNGVWIDEEVRWALQVEYTNSVKKREKNLHDLSLSAGIKSLDIKAADHDDEGVNPGSYDQIRDLLYKKWNLGIPAQMEARDFYTDTGLPGTGDAVLRAHLASGQLNDLQAAFVKELRLYRREKNKILGTVLIPLQRRSADPKKGLVWDDQRVRSTWNAHVTSVGRLSSSKPNLQNIGSRKGQGRLKSIFAAPPGRILVGADLDQAHLRIIANYWKIPRMVEAFVDGMDPHNLLAYDVFGNDFKNASGWGPDGFSLKRKPTSGSAKSMRDVMKTFRYASIYWAEPMTVWRVLTSTETDSGELPYLKFEPREVRHFHDRWMASEPEWQEAWASMMELYKRQGWMEEPAMRRRSGGLGDGGKNDVVNFPILAAESSLMRLAEHAVMDAFPFEKWGPGTGMIHQCHDSICVEVPEELGEWARGLLEECMTVRVPGWDVVLTSEADIGRTLKEV